MGQRAMREEEVNRFKELQDIFDKFFSCLVSVIALKTTDMGEELFIAHPILMMVIVLMIVIYFMTWIMGTMLPHRPRIIFIILLLCFMMMIASGFSVLVLTIISPLIACLTLLLWLAVFALTAYSLTAYYLYQMLTDVVTLANLGTIKDLFYVYRIQSTRVPV